MKSLFSTAVCGLKVRFYRINCQVNVTKGSSANLFDQVDRVGWVTRSGLDGKIDRDVTRHLLLEVCEYDTKIEHNLKWGAVQENSSKIKKKRSTERLGEKEGERGGKEPLWLSVAPLLCGLILPHFSLSKFACNSLPLSHIKGFRYFNSTLSKTLSWTSTLFFPFHSEPNSSIFESLLSHILFSF
jgi:hypothetical protein